MTHRSNHAALMLLLLVSLAGFIQACSVSSETHDLSDAIEHLDSANPIDTHEPQDGTDTTELNDSFNPSDADQPLDVLNYEDTAVFNDAVADVAEVDATGDVLLDASSSDTSHSQCQGTHEGDYTIQEPSDVDALSTVCSIAGSLYISGSGNLTTVSLPWLQSIGGKLYVFGTHPLDFDQNAAVNVALETLSFPALESIDGVLWMNGNVALTNADFSALKGIRNLWAEHNPVLGSLSLDSLIEVSHQGLPGEFIVGVGAWTHLTLPELETVGSLHVYENPFLKAFEAPSLASASDAVYIYRNDALESFDLGSLKTVGGNQPGLTHTLYAYDNPSLPQCLLDELLHQIESTGTMEGKACFQVDPPCAQSNTPGGTGDATLDACVCVDHGLESCCSVAWTAECYATATLYCDAFCGTGDAACGPGSDNKEGCTCSPVDGATEATCE